MNDSKYHKVDRTPPMTAYGYEHRWRLIARYHSEDGTIIDTISDSDWYPAIEKKYNDFLKNIKQVGTLIFCYIVVEGIGTNAKHQEQ